MLGVRVMGPDVPDMAWALQLAPSKAIGASWPLQAISQAPPALAKAVVVQRLELAPLNTGAPSAAPWMVTS